MGDHLRGVIAAGGTGTRLWPLTQVLNKHLLPVYDKPMIHYALSTLALAGIRDVCVVTTPIAAPSMRESLVGIQELGIHITVIEQPHAHGVADVLNAADEWLGKSSCLFVLGDNFFWGASLSGLLRSMMSTAQDGSITTFTVDDPSPYAVVEYDDEGLPRRILEKPMKTSSKSAIPGLYFYTHRARSVLETLIPSARGELEIADLNQRLLSAQRLEVLEAPRGLTWLDLGTFHELHEASSLVRIVQQRQGLMVGSLEEIALGRGWVTKEALKNLIKDHQSPYVEQLRQSIKQMA